MSMGRYRWALWALLPAAAGLAACPGTEKPKEHYGPPPAQGPDAATDAELPVDAGEGDSSLLPDLTPFFASCGEAPASDADFTRERLRQAAVACTSHQSCGFESAAQALTEAVDAYAANPDDETRSAAQRAFRAAMALWSRLEVMQYGPLGSMATSAGEDMYLGQGLREQVYAWPLAVPCRVDEQLVDRDYVDEGIEPQLVSAKGLFALEQLLFTPDEAPSACEAGSDTAEALAMLDPETRGDRRRDYARALAQEIAHVADQLVEAYDPAGSFAQQFVSASGYPSGQEALNVLGWALLYVDEELKDWKLGTLADLMVDAPVTQPESPLSGISRALLEQNLVGFRLLFEGCGAQGAGLGFDDWLEAAGRPELARDVLEGYDEALAGLRALPADLHEATPAQLAQAYEAMRALTTPLKADLFGPQSPLNLVPPASLEGDTD